MSTRILEGIGKRNERTWKRENGNRTTYTNIHTYIISYYKPSARIIVLGLIVLLSHLNRPNETRKGEGNYTDEASALLNHLKPLKNLWRVLMLALDTEFKSSKGLLPKSSIYSGAGSYRSSNQQS